MKFSLPKGLYVVVGMGLSGRATIRFLLHCGVECVGLEEIARENWERARNEFPKIAEMIYFEELPKEVFGKAKGFIVSPGVPLTRPWALEAKKRNIPVLGELEVASRHVGGSLLAVTGTNGKSTTVSLVHAILRAGGIRTALKGNIGDPLITAVSDPPSDWTVVEVSSFQLETIETFHPAISVILNITPDHLDRYAGLEDYAEAKGKIFMNQGAEDILIYNADDLHVLRLARRAPARKLPLSLVNEFREGAFVDRDEMVVRFAGREDRYPVDLGPLVGLHNQENKLAAILSASVVGVSPEIIRTTLSTFKPLSHRLQCVGIYRGISFYDDSKGTNVGSVVMSVASFDKGVMLILGGRDKGGDFSPLKAMIREKVKALILIGEATDKIFSFLGDVVPTYRVETMTRAVETCFAIGSTGDTALLSPGCASFDQYKNYAERGDDFVRRVRAIGEGRE